MILERLHTYLCVCAYVVIYSEYTSYQDAFVGKDNIEMLILKDLLHISMRELHGEIIIFVGFEVGKKRLRIYYISQIYVSQPSNVINH